MNSLAFTGRDKIDNNSPEVRSKVLLPEVVKQAGRVRTTRVVPSGQGVGAFEGETVGPLVGLSVGGFVGGREGDVVGPEVGEVVGVFVGTYRHDLTIPHGKTPLHCMRT